MKKMISFLMAVVLLIALTPVGAITVSAATSGKTGDCTWTLNGTHLTISGNGAMANYSSTDDIPWYQKITTVTIEEGVTNIGDNAFYFNPTFKGFYCIIKIIQRHFSLIRYIIHFIL